MISVIIPSRKEEFLKPTVDDLLAKASGEIEVLVGLEEESPFPVPEESDRVKIIRHKTPRGIRGCINSGVSVARGEYIMKLDAHCLVDEGFDLKLATECRDDWLMVPRRYSLDPDLWVRKLHKHPIDYEHYCYPYYKPPHIGLYNIRWNKRGYERADDSRYLIDDLMAFQGSCWFMKTDYFKKLIGRLDESISLWAGEPQEVSLKVWLGGGRVVVNKKTWYAHLFKGRKYRRTYYMNYRDNIMGHAKTIDFWLNNRWKERIHDFWWLVDKFWPIPTWPDDWKKQLKERPIPNWKEIVRINTGK